MAYYKDSLSYKIAVAAIIAALYAVLVWILPFISFFIWQVRIADCLLPQALIFGMPAAIGLALGCFAGNLIGGLGIIDYLGGALTNFLAAIIGYYLEKRNTNTGLKRVLITQLIITVQTLLNVFIVGTYLAFIFSMPLELSWLGILIGSLISLNLVGFLIYEALRKTNLFTLESKSANLDSAVQYIKRQFTSKIIKIKC
jgi:uncharacterized membrane protein